MTLEFYEKPGCSGNARQKEKLQSLGCLLVVKNLLSAEWSDDELRGFFDGKPKEEWFNMTAPPIKRVLCRCIKAKSSDGVRWRLPLF